MILNLLYLLIPAYIANITPVFARRIKWDTPLDFGLSVGKKRIFGDHKTWKGFITGTIAGTLVGIGLAKIYWPFMFSPATWSVLASSGALIGDAIKSFFKRRLGIKSGKPWIPFDEVDFTIGAIAFGSVVFFPGIINASIMIILSALGHIAVNHAAFYLKIRGEKW